MAVLELNLVETRLKADVFVVDVVELYDRSWKWIYLVPLIAFTVVVAYFDRLGFVMFQGLENPALVYQQLVTEYMALFHGFVFLSVFALTGAVFVYKGLRNALAFLVFSLAVVWSGVWDLLYYQFGATPDMPSELTHLADTPVGTAAAVFNDGVVTPEMVVLNAFLFLLIGLPLAGYIRFGDIPVLNDY